MCFYQQIARALQSLMDWDPEAGEDMESHFMLTFQVSTDMFGFVHTHNLKENGDTIPVTKDNRKVWLLCVGVYVGCDVNSFSSCRNLLICIWTGCSTAVLRRVLVPLRVDLI